MTIKILDLFAGAGGLSLGFELLKDNLGNDVFELYRAVEIDKYACETLRNRHGTEKVIWGDLTTEEVHKKVIRDCKGIVSIIMGGIPCQSFSLIGTRSGRWKTLEKFKQDKRDYLYREFRNIVKEILPKVVVIENVKGILSKKDRDGEKIINKIISDFEELGYKFENNKNRSKYMLLNAADYGVPQKRERVILIGIKKSWKNSDVPFIEPTHFDHSSENRKAFLKKDLLPYVTLYDAIGDLPEVKPKITKTDLTKEEIRKIGELNAKIESGNDRISFDKKRFLHHMRNICLPGKHFLNFIRPNGYAFLDHHVARRQQLSDIELFGYMTEGETAEEFITRKPELSGLIKYPMSTFRDKYRRQKWDEPSTTVYAHLEKDGNRFIHPGYARTLTPREAARIQSFPDDVTFCGPMSKKFRQIGNAVPPLMAYNIAKAIKALFTSEHNGSHNIR